MADHPAAVQAAQASLLGLPLELKRMIIKAVFTDLRQSGPAYAINDVVYWSTTQNDFAELKSVVSLI